MTDQDWISTGKAVDLLGGYYCADYFRKKFFAILEAEGSAVRLPSGHIRWKTEAMLRLRVFAKGA
jgi:hypothetical protein